MTTTLRFGEIPPKARRPEPPASALPKASRAASRRNSRRVYASPSASSSAFDDLLVLATELAIFEKCDIRMRRLLVFTASWRPDSLLYRQIGESLLSVCQPRLSVARAAFRTGRIAPVPAASHRCEHKPVQADNAHQ